MPNQYFFLKISVSTKNPFGCSVDHDVTKKKPYRINVYDGMLVFSRWYWHAACVTSKGDGIPNFAFVTRTVWVSELVPAWREMKR